MVCFFGIKKEGFKVGRAVLPKFYLEDVGLEIFEVLKRGGKKVSVSKLPQVMVEDFLREYLEIDVVVGGELKVFHGYFVGLIEEKKKDIIWLEEILVKNRVDSNMIGISGFNVSLDDHQLFSRCKRSWQRLPKQKYPKPLIFHDGRLALRPTPLDAVAIFMWAPFGFVLAIFRILKGKKSKGLLYVCNHKTLLDPVYLNVILNTSVTGVTYSVSRISETLSPIKTVRLSRNRDQDGRMVESLLNQGDVVVCPEGTTCREPYLLRFSPLFAELGDVIVPVAIDSHVTMFYGTTASGLKCLDPLFCLMNPTPMYTVQFLEKVSGLSKSCSTSSNGGVSKFDVANHVQSEIGKALGFECTNLTRRDKYLILVGNEGKKMMRMILFQEKNVFVISDYT
ncbi:putative glycerol-3-phosphate acyltransferase 3 [Quercus suber]|uniref:Glycerol-3-phosphate acyltransferase 3 n=1 Tax=Quercus suber TaxID=58331 RepID=A0AAW0M104_QUESU